MKALSFINYVQHALFTVWRYFVRYHSGETFFIAYMTHDQFTNGYSPPEQLYEFSTWSHKFRLSGNDVHIIIFVHPWPDTIGYVEGKNYRGYPTHQEHSLKYVARLSKEELQPPLCIILLEQCMWVTEHSQF